MNAFFAAIEQQQNKKLRNKPVAITNGEQGSTIITSSYEARAYGIYTGMRYQVARTLCPDLIRVAARPTIYADISRKIMQALEHITPDIEVFSIDEAFLDVTACQTLFGTPEKMGIMVRDIIREAVNLPCSIGISGDKTTAKFAAKQQKPNGFTVIHPEHAAKTLAKVPVTELCGIGKNIATFLAKYGVINCGDMKKIPVSILGKRFGHWGRRIWFMCQGQDPEAVKAKTAAAKSMGHGKVIPPKTTDRETILTYFMYLTEKLSRRLRANDLQAQTFFIGVKNYKLGWFGIKAQLMQPSASHRLIYTLCKKHLFNIWQGEGLCQVQITALDPQPKNLQGDLFCDQRTTIKQQYLDTTIDAINTKFTTPITTARIVNNTINNSPIAPAWQPNGPRKTV
jgi:DNA polymerase-4